jgi:hypothetical protein
MDPDFAQRRRVFVAIAVTAVAVPGAFLLSRGDGEAGAPPVTLVGTVAPPGATVPPTAPIATPAATNGGDVEDIVLGTTPTGYLDGTVPPEVDDPPTIAIPRPRNARTGEATFSDEIGNVEQCHIWGAPIGVTATLVNLDNSRSVKCEVVPFPNAPPDLVVLHADAFSLIADITEAPVPVEISW